MATWVHLSTYLLFFINLTAFKLFNAEGAVFRMASVKHADLKFPEKRSIPTLPGRHKKFDVASTSI